MSEPQTNLRVRISGDLADIKQGLGLLRGDLAKLQAAGTKAGKDLTSGFGGLNATLSGLRNQVLGFGAAFLSVQAAAQAFTTAINQADKLNDLTIRYGVSAEAISGWGYAARQTGTDVDALGIGMKKLSKNLEDARDPTSSSAKLFDALGISIKDGNGHLKSMEQIVPEIADVFKTLDSATEEAALAQDLFGKSGTDMLEFLNLGSGGLQAMRDRARELGIELSQSTLSGADAFNDTLGDLKAATQGLTTQMAAELLPMLTDGLNALIDLAKDGSFASEVVDSLSAVVDGAAAAFGGATSLTDAFSNALKEMGGSSDIAKYKVSDLFKVMGDVGKLLGSFGDRIAGGINELTGTLTGDASLKASGVFQQREAMRKGRKALYGQPDFDGVSTRVTGTNIADFSGVEGRALTNADYNRKALEDRLNKLLSTGSGGGKSDAERKAEQLRKELKKLEEQTKASLDKLREQEIKQEEELQKQLDDAETELLRATGHDAEASFRDIDAKWKELLDKLKANGNTAGTAIVEQLIDTQKLQARLASFQAKAKEILGSLSNTETSLSAQSDSGALGFAESETRLADVRQKSLQQLQQLRAEVQAYYTATKDPSVLAYLQELDGNIATVGASQQKLRQQASDAAIDSVATLFEDMADSSKDASDSVEEFAKNFAKSMVSIAARALATYLVLQLFDAIYPGLGKATAAGMSAGVRHGGGIAGAGGTRRSGLSPLMFGNAPQYHNGGIAGLRPNEVPIVAELGEEILTTDDPRHRNNLKGGGGTGVDGVLPISLTINKIGSGDGDASVDARVEEGKLIVSLTLAEVTRQAGTKGSKLNRAIRTGMGSGTQHG